MKKWVALMLTALVVLLQIAATAQGTANFSGTWKLDKTEPPSTITITQTAANLTVQYASTKAVYTLDGKQTITPAGDINALKTWAHWDRSRLHLHHKQAMSFGRDILALNGSSLTVTRDLETGGGSTTRTLTYSRQM